MEEIKDTSAAKDTLPSIITSGLILYDDYFIDKNKNIDCNTNVEIQLRFHMQAKKPIIELLHENQPK